MFLMSLNNTRKYEFLIRCMINIKENHVIKMITDEKIVLIICQFIILHIFSFLAVDSLYKQNFHVDRERISIFSHSFYELSDKTPVFSIKR